MSISTRMAVTESMAIDPPIQRLLAQEVNSALKLHLVLLFHDNSCLEGSARQLTERIFRDIWSTRDALRELARDGILAVRDSAGEPIYSYRPTAEQRVSIVRLVECFNDPFARDRIHAQLRDLAEATTCPCSRR